MAGKEKYLIKIQGKLIEVSEDVYYAYFHMERQERTQEEKKQRNEVMSYPPSSSMWRRSLKKDGR